MNKRLLLLLTMLLVSPVLSANPPPKVSVAQGELLGLRHADTSVDAFLGIPFAAPPVNQLRWRPPQAAEKWQGVMSATRFADRCMQNPIFDDMLFRASGVSEDCLYLNVWTPITDSTQKRPVLLYFYGGGFAAGDGSEPRYDGEQMATNDIVVVTANYRLGLFGLMAHPELSAESGYAGSGNYTFMDQVAALKWTVENIAAFGGDPNRITIGGESAGSLSVSMLMASPLSRDLISGAIGQSGSILGPTLSILDLAAAENQGSALASAILSKDKEQIKALRELPAEELLDKATQAGFQWFSPTVDGYLMPSSPLDIYANNQQAQIPLLAGNNSQEASYREILAGKPVNKANYLAALKQLYPGKHQQVFTLYPGNTTEQIKDSAQALAGDRFLAFSTWNWMDYSTRQNPQKSFFYYYDQMRPAPVGTQYTADNRPRGAVHSAEIEYALGNLNTHPAYQWQEADFQVSAIMHQYFANFIKTGNPNGEGLPDWPDFSKDQQLIIRTLPVSENIEYLRDRYQFLRTYYNQQVQD